MNDRTQIETRVHPQPVMRETKAIRSPRLSTRVNKAIPVPPSSKQAEELMELAVDAAQSRQLPEFLERFARRAARMLDAAWGGVAVFRGRETDLYSASDNEKAISSALKSWIISSARESRVSAVVRALPAGNAESPEGGAVATSAVFVPVNASDGERLGMLCLLRRRKSSGRQREKAAACLGEPRCACRWKISDDFRSWKSRRGSGSKISTRSAITSWCMTEPGKFCVRIARWRRIWACRRWRWLAKR